MNKPTYYYCKIDSQDYDKIAPVLQEEEIQITVSSNPIDYVVQNIVDNYVEDNDLKPLFKELDIHLQADVYDAIKEEIDYLIDKEYLNGQIEEYIEAVQINNMERNK